MPRLLDPLTTESGFIGLFVYLIHFTIHSFVFFLIQFFTVFFYNLIPYCIHFKKKKLLYFYTLKFNP